MILLESLNMKAWAERNGHTVPVPNKTASYLLAHGYKRERTMKARGWRGFGVRPDVLNAGPRGYDSAFD